MSGSNAFRHRIAPPVPKPYCLYAAAMSLEEAAVKVWLSAVWLPALISICWDDRVMQGFERPDRGLWDVSALVGHLMPESGMFAFLACHRGEVFPDADWADLF